MKKSYLMFPASGFAEEFCDQRIVAFGTQRATEETMIQDNSSSCNAFREKIAESQALKSKAENQANRFSIPFMSAWLAHLRL